jgi:hypothetical protein
MKFGRNARPRRPPPLATDLAEMEAADPRLRELGERIDDFGRAIAGLPVKHRIPSADATREREAKARREAEAEAWIAEVRARKAKR